MDQFRDAKDQLEDEERLERREEKKLNSPVGEWGGEEEKEYIRERRLRRRERILPVNRRCTRCGIVRLEPRQWVILLDGKWVARWWNKRGKLSAICRSCYGVTPTGSIGKLLTAEIWWKINARALKVARYAKDMTSAEVAKACGWSQGRQSKLETREGFLVKDADVNRLIRALDIPAPVIGEATHKYVLKAGRLSIARKAVGVSQRTLAAVIGVSATRIRHLEQRTSVISPKVASALIRALQRISEGERLDIEDEGL